MIPDRYRTDTGTLQSEAHPWLRRRLRQWVGGGGGGGRPTMAQGGGTNGDGIPNALKAANTLLGL